MPDVLETDMRQGRDESRKVFGRRTRAGKVEAGARQVEKMGFGMQLFAGAGKGGKVKAGGIGRKFIERRGTTKVGQTKWLWGRFRSQGYRGCVRRGRGE